jgi:hypothetical protein
MFEACRSWLVLDGVALAVVGAIMALATGTPAVAAAGRRFDRPFWPAGTDAVTRRFQAWAYSVTFATMAGWGVALAMIAANAFPSRQAWAWWSIAGGMIVWFVLDTGRSLRYRVHANAVLNAALLLMVAIPLALTAGEFG